VLYLEGVANSLLLLNCIVPFLKKTTRTSEGLVEVAQEYRKLQVPNLRDSFQDSH